MKIGGLFNSRSYQPLADLIRPKHLEDVIGQKHILSPDAPFLKELLNGSFISTLFWGPPGTGKTTLSRLIATQLNANYEELSAVNSGIADMRSILDVARSKNILGSKTLVFIDEIHRLNRSQQDFLLPYIEDGSICLVAATTENPSFELNAALLSRMRTILLERLSEADLCLIIKRVEAYLNHTLPITENVRSYLCRIADGDGRMIINYAEMIHIQASGKILDLNDVQQIISKKLPTYDKNGEFHYNLISALHKSIRGSDVDAALYWFNRMRIAGEDLLYVTRRLIRLASEDIGLADPNALVQATQSFLAYERLGSPEGDLCIAQAIAYLATAPKSNALYLAHKVSSAFAEDYGSLPPPKNILNAPTELMKEQGYGKNYIYDHDEIHGFSGQNYFPDALDPASYYRPKEVGFEREIKKRMVYWQKLRNKINKKP